MVSSKSNSAALLLVFLLSCCCSYCLSFLTTSNSFVTPSLVSRHAYSLSTVNAIKKGITSGTAVPAEVEEDDIYDLVVLGGGPVGCSAAFKAATAPFNKRVCLVDAPRAGGVLMDGDKDLSLGGPTGLFSKALRDTSKRIRVSSLRGMGLRDDSIWNEIITSCVDLASANADDVVRQLEFSGVEYVQGFASFVNSEKTSPKLKSLVKDVFVTEEENSLISLTVKLDGGSTFKVLKARHVLIATGSKPFQPEGIPFDGVRIFDSDSINTLSYLPKSMVITGSGIIAVEMAKIFNNLGADVSLIIRDNIPRNALMKIGLDKDIAALLVADLVRSGIHIERGAQVSEFQVPISERAPIKVTLEGAKGEPRPAGTKTEVLCDTYLAAVGRLPNTFGLNLEAIGVDLDTYGCIPVNAELQTTCTGVFAAGDVLGRPFLASTGLAQGVSAIDNMFGEYIDRSCYVSESDSVGINDENELCVDGNLGSAGASYDPIALAANPFAFPVGVWSSPEAAYYGLSTQQAQKLGMLTGEGIALYAECLRGRVFSPDGLLKLVFDKTSERIIGVHICGDDACELVHYGMELVRSKRTLTDVAKNTFSAVTFHELYRLAALAGLDEATARKRRAAVGSALAASKKAKLSKGRS